jgi:hypothetical protein
MDRDALEARRIFGRIVAKAWEDDAFKQRLMTSPVAVLKEHGMEVLPGVDVKIVEGRGDPEIEPTKMVLPLPPRPSSEELATEELDQVAGGVWCCSSGCRVEPIKSGTWVNSYYIRYT